mmetsp:Transcript_7794/g.11922  ORF Transcript_7794/g.11922 Transcript_7794/m.11922 type:complete len:109 (-) Transcript_7794:165-491(-)|eukprot:CAMPEP_0178906920 /NCGR_PEP_ID=MMETSP0786-20121207/7083_1 /TAXON_ID=186022 /ORGANISM="Thalassionema frauenfeldii, Strain CCMP 1798" /LENGTH=108 /DNA_ID=CAMNT_0020578661 /DNA_START=51 /DNA_END=377 /DNA_ORIENTATION=-
MVKFIKSANEYDELIELSKSKLVVIDFTATWCGPCQMVAPIFEELATAHPEVEFIKVDVDDGKDIAMKCEISAMPTFQFYKGGEKVDEIVGANVDKLKEVIEANKLMS